LSAGVTRLGIASAPFLRSGLSTRRLMWEVVGSLVPVIAAATWYFGVTALCVVVVAATGALLTEWTLDRERARAGSLRDGSALLTGVLLALTLPPSIPLWMAFLGGVVSIALGKTIWGGLGRNLFNPALVGRAFLQAAFPVILTTWTPPRTGMLNVASGSLALPLTGAVDATTTATPLGAAKFEGRITELLSLLTGNTAGSLGETAALVLIACGLYLGRCSVWRPRARPCTPSIRRPIPPRRSCSCRGGCCSEPCSWSPTP
jgi:electron transport complex protein RnfD